MTPRGDRPTSAGLSDVGRVRSHNEDAVLLTAPLYAVADGLGGHQAGEIASTLAVESLLEHAPLRADAKALGRAVRAANRAVIDGTREGLGRAGMGTTLTAAIVEGTTVVVAHVGDSRAYVFHSGGLERITEDHSVVADLVRQGSISEEEARSHPNRSVITRALGSDPNMFADTYEVDVDAGDRLLLCTDGLTSMLTDAQIEDILRSTRDPETAVRALIDAANAAGGQDNISAVIVEVEGEAVRERRRRGWLSVSVWVFVAAALAFAAVYGTREYARSRAYVIAEDDFVALYRGIPGSLAGFELHWLEEDTTIPVSALGTVTSARLAEPSGIQVESVAAGQALIQEYRSRVETPGSRPADAE